MLLMTGDGQARFCPRPLEGVVLQNGTQPERLILDGQQRPTSLFQSIFSQRAAETRECA